MSAFTIFWRTKPFLPNNAGWNIRYRKLSIGRGVTHVIHNKPIHFNLLLSIFQILHTNIGNFCHIMLKETEYSKIFSFPFAQQQMFQTEISKFRHFPHKYLQCFYNCQIEWTDQSLVSALTVLLLLTKSAGKAAIQSFCVYSRRPSAPNTKRLQEHGVTQLSSYLRNLGHTVMWQLLNSAIFLAHYFSDLLCGTLFNLKAFICHIAEFWQVWMPLMMNK